MWEMQCSNGSEIDSGSRGPSSIYHYIAHGKVICLKNVMVKFCFLQCKVNPKKIDPSNTARVPEGMMATRKMTYSAYRELMHDPLMEDPVKPTSFNSHSKKVSRAWFIKDGIWSVLVMLSLTHQPFRVMLFVVKTYLGIWQLHKILFEGSQCSHLKASESCFFPVFWTIS